MKGVFKETPTDALSYSALEKRDSRIVTGPTDDKVPAPNCVGCLLILRATTGRGPLESLPFVAWKWKSGPALYSAKIWKVKQGKSGR